MTILEKQKSDYDCISDWIKETGYKPKTTLDNLIWMIISYFDCIDNYDDYGEEFTIEGCKNYVEDSGGIAEFDFYC